MAVEAVQLIGVGGIAENARPSLQRGIKPQCSLHSRFYSDWAPGTSVTSLGGKCRLVKGRASADGLRCAVSKFLPIIFLIASSFVRDMLVLVLCERKPDCLLGMPR